MLDYAIRKATQMPYVQGQRRVYSVVVDRKENILAEGQNSYVKSHPLQAKYAEMVGLDDKIFLHAEISSLVKIRRGVPYKIYIARVDSEDNPCLAAPCEICHTAIHEAGIHLIEHTV